MPIFRHLLGVVTTLLFVVLTCAVILPILVLAVFKVALPFPRWQALCNRMLDWLASLWMEANARHQQFLLPTQLDIHGLDNLSTREWYMMVANHQSWVDILLLLRIFNGRIPYLKFFLKRSLIWVPLLGLAWWALDFPFMHRHTKAQIARDPSLQGKDIEQTRKACEKFRHNPVTIINFLEGTRYTHEKYTQQKSSYRHLLMPKAGGLAFTLAAMDGQLHRLLDVTIYYPAGIPTYWDYACGRVKEIRVHIRQLPIPAELIGDYIEDAEFRAGFQQWVNQLWREKDDLIDSMTEVHQKIS
ncbi:MAG TPA: acyltransferase [Cellvibrio sp.]|nr:acyltransferase [Cellvibrio sp.]